MSLDEPSLGAEGLADDYDLQIYGEEADDDLLEKPVPPSLDIVRTTVATLCIQRGIIPASIAELTQRVRAQVIIFIEERGDKIIDRMTISEALTIVTRVKII